ncbi:MAG: hypothetical protein AB1696_21045 [Planctomycetota bacterium]
MDTITIYCGKCGEELKAKVVDAGGVMRCSKCRVRIPIPNSNLDRPQIRVFCPKCGARLRGWPDEAGKQVECRRCKKIISLPHIHAPAEGGRAKDAKAERKKELPGLAKEESATGRKPKEEKIEKEEIKIEPAKKRRAGDAPILSFTDSDVAVDANAGKKSKASVEKEGDEEAMISFDEFLVDDAAKPAKKKRPVFPEPESASRKPKLAPEEKERAARDTDALPPARAPRKEAPPPTVPAKTLVIECRKCGMRLVFRDGNKPRPGAGCPSCGEKLAL